jgi:hypothetical protein
VDRIGVDTSPVDDGFNFGEPAKRPAKLGTARGRAAPSVDLRLVLIGVGLVAAASVLFVFLSGAHEAGREIGKAEVDTIAQVDRAQDAAAQTSATRAIVVARTVTAENGSFPEDAATLSAFEPSIQFTSGASTGPDQVAVAATPTTFGAAVRSESDTCWWISIDQAGVTRYGSGDTCTGRAAMGATATAW